MTRGTEAQPRLDESLEAHASAETEFAKFERLDRLVRGLVERFQTLQVEHTHTLTQLAERDEQIRELNQRRQDAGKRLDDVLARLDRLDAQFERRLGAPSEDES